MRSVKLGNIIKQQKQINALSAANLKNIFVKMSCRASTANTFHVKIFSCILYMRFEPIQISIILETVVMKDHTSHDILLLCPRCHQLSNASDVVVREKLAIECDAPLASKEATRKIDVPRLRYVPQRKLLASQYAYFTIYPHSP